MTIAEAQESVDQWIRENGVRYFSELTNIAVLMEEVGEVARIMARKYGEQSYKADDKEANLSDDLADVFFVLLCISNQTNIDLTAAFKNNLEKKKRRDSNRHKSNPKLNS